ncbi:MAG: VCBS repeat-containing protein [Bacillota bacterium]
MDKRIAQTVITSQTADVTGDGVADEVYLTGTYTEGSPFIQNITLMIRNGRTGRITQFQLANNSGYDPTLFLCDFTGDGIPDIKVTIQSGGSGGFTFSYIYSFANSQLRLLFSGDDYGAPSRFRANYVDGYIVVVNDDVLGLEFRIDVSRDPAAADLYNPDGTLKQPTEANVGPFIAAIPIVLDEASGTCSLQVLTRVYGTFAADTLGYIQDYLVWGETGFETFREDLAINPSG